MDIINELMDKVGEIQGWVDYMYSHEGDLDTVEASEIERVYKIIKEQE